MNKDIQVQLKCQVCGKEFPDYKRLQGRKRRYCSFECKQEGDKRLRKQRGRKTHQLICQRCGANFSSTNKHQQYCGRACAHSKPPKECRCNNCGKVFIPKAADRTICCSRRCGFKWLAFIAGEKAVLNQIAQNWKWRPKPERHCVICGEVLQGRLSRLCGKRECQLESGRQWFRANWVSVRETNSFVKKTCEYCGVEYETNYLAVKRKYCSARCAKRHHRNKRDARWWGAKVEECLSVFHLAQRDGYRCGICGKKVNMKYKFPHSLSATIDHIIPLANGGKHSNQNIQLAHFTCNSKKQARTGGQLRLFG